MKLLYYLTILGFVFLTVCGRPEPPEQPIFRIVDVCSLPGYANRVVVSEGLAYIADNQAGLQVVNVANPESTYIVGGYPTSENAQGIAVRDSLAFVVLSSNAGLAIINISNPAQCSIIAVDGGYSEYDVHAPADSYYVYIAAFDYLIVEDCSIPQYPNRVQRLGTPGNVRGVFVAYDMVFIACEEMGIRLYESALPDSQVALLSSIDTPSNARDLYVVDGYIYVADGRTGLVIVDITDPALPKLCATCATSGYANEVVVNNSYAYVADGDGGVQIIDVHDPHDPVFYAEIETSYANGITIDDTLIYVADRDMGLIIITEEVE
jgi:hypothetical protein